MHPKSSGSNEHAPISIDEVGTKTNHVGGKDADFSIPQNRPEISTQNENLAKKITSADVDARNKNAGFKRRRSSSKKKLTPKSDSSLVGAGGENEDASALSNLEVIINSTRQLCSKWDGLQLGEKTGTAALNNYFKHVIGTNTKGGTDNDTFSKYTGVEMVQMFDTLYPKYISTDSHTNVSDSTTVDQDGDVKIENQATEDAKSPLLTLPGSSLAFIQSDSLANEINLKRRKIHHLDLDGVINKLKQYENEVCRLKLEEDKVLSEGKELGLLD